VTARRAPAPAPVLHQAPRTAPSAGRGRRRPALIALTSRLTVRDVWLLEMLAEHTVLTTHHITALWRTGPRSARRRLAELHRLGLLDSFRPRLERGGAPEHYLLAAAGADLLAARHATTPAALGWRPDLITRTAYSPQLGHLLGVAGFFTRLAAHSAVGAQELAAWWSERRCEQLWGDLVRPDGYGRLARPGREPVAFVLEYDTGTEPQPRLVAKIGAYADAAQATATRPLVLFTLRSRRRETNLHQALAGNAALERVAVATTARDLAATGQGAHDPADAVWLPAGRPMGRCRIADLPEAWPPGQRPASELPGHEPALPAPDPLLPHRPTGPRPTSA
jgi:hypothetical protein